MEGQYLSPGVFFYEMEQRLTQSANTEAAIGIVGGATKGSLEPTVITSTSQLYSVFGEPSKDDYGVLAASIVLKNSGKVIYKRVVHEFDEGVCARALLAKGTLVITSTVEGEEGNKFKAKIYKLETWDENDVSTHYFNVSIIDNNNDVIFSDDFSAQKESPDYIEKSIPAEWGYTAYVAPTGLLISDDEETADFSGGKDVVIKAAYATAGDEETDHLVFTTKTYDSTLNGAIVSVRKDAAGLVSVSITKEEGAIETLFGFSLVPTDENYIGILYNGQSRYLNIQVFPENLYTDVTLTLRGGLDGIEGITAKDIIGTKSDQGMQSFFAGIDIDINTLIVPGWSDINVVKEGVRLAEFREDIIYLPDCPIGLSPQQVIDWSNGEGLFSTNNYRLDSKYAALFYPWGYTRNKLTHEARMLPITPFIAAQFAKVQKTVSPWSAVAGFSTGIIEDLEGLQYNPTQVDRDNLYGKPEIVNPVTEYKDRGIVIMGNKTTRRPTYPALADSLSTINVIRVCNHIRRYAIYKSYEYLFKPNTENTWADWCMAIEIMLQEILDGGGIANYKVIMNETTISPENLRNGVMPGTIMVQPVSVAEYIEISFKVYPLGMNFE